jgi:hypothetical protein
MDTNIKNSVSDILNEVSSGLSKKQNSQIKTENSHLKLAPKYFEVSWQTYRILAFIFFILSFAVMKYIIDYFSEKIEDKELINILKIISFFFVLNFGTFLFITVYYKYRKSTKGIKGNKGDQGKRGLQGNASYCNICEKKSGGFKRDYKGKFMKEEVVPSVLLDFSENKKPYWKLLDNNVQLTSGGNNKFRIMTPSYIGPGKPTEANVINKEYPSNQKINRILNSPINNKDPFVNQIKPIIGVSASYNEDTGELYSIIFFVDKNKFHNPQRYKFTPLGKTIGKTKKMGIGNEFKCPRNTAIYKIEVFHNGSMIVSLRLHCANVETGERVEVVDPITNKKRSYATIGKQISKYDKEYFQETVEAGRFIANGEMYQAFISQVAGVTDNSTDDIYSLGFLRASVFVKGFKFL